MKAFTDRYGHKLKPDGTVDQAGVIDNLMAWNEPDYRGTGKVDKNGQRDLGDPLKKKPVLAARLVAQANAACFPRSSPPRCGHMKNGQFEPGNIVAGEFVGRPKGGDAKVNVREGRKTRKKAFTKAYHDEIAKFGAGRQPQVWSFHDYGDAKAFLLFRGRAKKAAAVATRFTSQYRSTNAQGATGDYRYRGSDNDLHRPQIWMTEGGSPYHYGCGEIPKSMGTRTRLCTNSVTVVLFGMGKQRNALAFMLSRFASLGINRLYNFNFHSGDDKCGAAKRIDNTFACLTKETGLVGKRDDDLYRSPDAATSMKIRDLSAGSSDTSLSGERRLAFCLLRDKRSGDVAKPTRVKRSQCPAG